jgi:hypothetical protein
MIAPHNSIAPLNFTQRFAHAFELGLKYGYTLPIIEGGLDRLFPVQLLFVAPLVKPSVWPAPPDQPPRSRVFGLNRCFYELRGCHFEGVEKSRQNLRVNEFLVGTLLKSYPMA